MGAITSGVVPTSSPPIAVDGTISKMLDGLLLREETFDVKGKAVPMQNSNLDIMKAIFINLGGLTGSPIPWVVSCKSKGLNDSVVLPDGMGGDTMEGGTALHVALSSSPKGQPPRVRERFDPLVIDTLAVLVVDSDEEDLALAFGDQKFPVQIEGEQEEDAMVYDMGMDFNIPIRVFFDDLKQITKARRTVDSRANIAQNIVGRSEKTPIVSKASKHNKFSSLGLRSSARLEARGIIKSTAKPKASLGKQPEIIDLSEISSAAHVSDSSELSKSTTFNEALML
ncbi:hypothetical protein AMTR_s00086p00117950 [Amborella trichopoda]|uniref:Uncharacterized protein n=1 Tax=Amborella trichopoda TaxID=13333 RepID=W1P5E8_AMBTC|nr:hypothetical protein AMTR_s00086p00117950 [Amborella trichopoda]